MKIKFLVILLIFVLIPAPSLSCSEDEFKDNFSSFTMGCAKASEIGRSVSWMMKQEPGFNSTYLDGDMNPAYHHMEFFKTLFNAMHRLKPAQQEVALALNRLNSMKDGCGKKMLLAMIDHYITKNKKASQLVNKDIPPLLKKIYGRRILFYIKTLKETEARLEDTEKQEGVTRDLSLHIDKNIIKDSNKLLNYLLDQQLPPFALADAKILKVRAHGYNHLSKHVKAAGELTKLIDLDPQNVENFGNRGIAYMKARKWKSAIQDFNRVVELEPDSVRGYHYLAVIYADCADKSFRNGPKGVDMAKKALRRNDDLKINFLLAAAYIENGQHQHALDAYNSIIKKEPKAIKIIQTRLKKSGNYTGEIDGLNTPELQQALKEHVLDGNRI